MRRILPLSSNFNLISTFHFRTVFKICPTGRNALSNVLIKTCNFGVGHLNGLRVGYLRGRVYLFSLIQGHSRSIPISVQQEYIPESLFIVS